MSLLRAKPNKSQIVCADLVNNDDSDKNLTRFSKGGGFNNLLFINKYISYSFSHYYGIWQISM